MTRVAIIGGGIGGLNAARALCRRGIEVAIYEAAPELREIGAGVALGPNAMKALRSLGLEEDVRGIAGRWDWAVTRNWKTGRVISRTSRDQQAVLFGAAGATAHRADLLDVLARLAAERHRHAGRAVHRGRAGRPGRGGEVRGRQRSRGRRDHRRRRDPLASCEVRCSARTLRGSPARSATAVWSRSTQSPADRRRTRTSSGSGRTARSCFTPCDATN